MDYLVIYEKILMRGKTRTKVNRDFLHKHRIIPGHEGGTYDPDNVSLLTRKEHRIIHKLRYILYRQTADKLAYGWLSSKLSDDEVNKLKHQGAVLGGKKTVALMKEQKRGLFGRSAEKMSADGTKAAKVRQQNWREKNKEKIREKEEKATWFPLNKSTSYCIGCHKEVQPSRLMRSHRNCFKKFNFVHSPSGYKELET